MSSPTDANVCGLVISIIMLGLSTKTDCSYLNGWIKKNGHICKNLTKMVNPRDIVGELKCKSTVGWMVAGYLKSQHHASVFKKWI